MTADKCPIIGSTNGEQHPTIWCDQAGSYSISKYLIECVNEQRRVTHVFPNALVTLENLHIAEIQDAGAITQHLLMDAEL